MKRRVWLLALGLVGCDTETAAPGMADDTGGVTEPAEETASTEAGSTGAVELVDQPVSGLELTLVSANQGVEVPVVTDGEWVAGNARNAELIRERETLLRGFIEADENFEPREVRARVTLRYADDREETAEKVLFVEGSSTERDINSQVWFLVPGELVEPGMRFQIELFEADPVPLDEASDERVAYPPKPEFLGIEANPMQLKVVLVPIEHDVGEGCADAPVIDEALAESFRAKLYMQNPVHDVEITVREPVAYTQNLSSFTPLLSTLATLRDSDGADPAAYYYGLVIPCGGGPTGVDGQAIDIPKFPDQGNAWTRVAVGRWHAQRMATTTDTFVHEIGHTQGRRHIACSGQEAGTDPSYPYEAGAIGTWGFGVLDFSLHAPTSAKDYMTYCGNAWISDWGWSRVVPFIREISSWELSDQQPETKPLLIGLVDPDTGDESWFVTQGRVPPERTITDHLEVDVASRTTQLELSRAPLGDGNAYSLVTELPEDVSVDIELGQVRALTRQSPTRRIPVRQIQIRDRVVDVE